MNCLRMLLVVTGISIASFATHAAAGVATPADVSRGCLLRTCGSEAYLRSDGTHPQGWCDYNSTIREDYSSKESTLYSDLCVKVRNIEQWWSRWDDSGLPDYMSVSSLVRYELYVEVSKGPRIELIVAQGAAPPKAYPIDARASAAVVPIPIAQRKARMSFGSGLYEFDNYSPPPVSVTVRYPDLDPEIDSLTLAEEIQRENEALWPARWEAIKAQLLSDPPPFDPKDEERGDSAGPFALLGPKELEWVRGNEDWNPWTMARCIYVPCKSEYRENIYKAEGITLDLVRTHMLHPRPNPPKRCSGEFDECMPTFTVERRLTGTVSRNVCFDLYLYGVGSGDPDVPQEYPVGPYRELSSLNFGFPAGARVEVQNLRCGDR